MNPGGVEALARQVRHCYPRQKIEAVKVVREHTGLGLAEAKSAVDGLWDRFRSAEAHGVLDDRLAIAALSECGVALRPLGIEREPDRELNPQDLMGLAEELRRARPRNKIEAVKIVREHTGLSLKDARDLVDRTWKMIERTAPARDDSAPEYEVRSRGIPLVVWVGLVLLAVAVAFLYLK